MVALKMIYNKPDISVYGTEATLQHRGTCRPDPSGVPSHHAEHCKEALLIQQLIDVWLDWYTKKVGYFPFQSPTSCLSLKLSTS